MTRKRDKYFVVSILNAIYYVRRSVSYKRGKKYKHSAHDNNANKSRATLTRLNTIEHNAGFLFLHDKRKLSRNAVETTAD